MNKETYDILSDNLKNTSCYLRDIGDLAKVINSHYKDIVSKALTDKILSIGYAAEDNLKNLLDLISFEYTSSELGKKLVESEMKVKEVLDKSDSSSIDKVPEDFYPEYYDDSTGKYVDEEEDTEAN